MATNSAIAQESTTPSIRALAVGRGTYSLPLHKSYHPPVTTQPLRAIRQPSTPAGFFSPAFLSSIPGPSPPASTYECRACLRRLPRLCSCAGSVQLGSRSNSRWRRVLRLPLKRPSRCAPSPATSPGWSHGHSTSLHFSTNQPATKAAGSSDSRPPCWRSFVSPVDDSRSWCQTFRADWHRRLKHREPLG